MFGPVKAVTSRQLLASASRNIKKLKFAWISGFNADSSEGPRVLGAHA
jgi:hypothetical protein